MALAGAGPARAQSAATTPAAAAAAATLTLPQALREARASLEVAIARGGLDAARADVRAADHAPLPLLSAKAASIDLQHGVGGGSWVGRKRIDKSIGLDWTWERGGKRALRTRAAQEAADAAQQDLDDVVTQQLLATQAAFHDLLAAQERVALTDALAQDARQLADTAGRRVKAGDLARQDASRIEIEAERARAAALAALLHRERAALALGQLTGRAAGAERLAVSGAWTLREPPPMQADLETLARQRADVRAAELRVRAAQAALEGARALRKADVTIGASIDHYPGTSNRLLELRAQMPLTWGYDYQGEIGRALAQRQQAEDQLEKTLRDARAELRRLQLEAQTASARARQYEQDILPRAREVAQTAENAYTRGGLALTDLLDARRTLRATLLDALATRADAAKAAAAWRLRSQDPSTDPDPLP